MLSNRLKQVLPGLIYKEQGAFIQQGRLISNNILLASEIHHSVCSKPMDSAMMIKLDMGLTELVGASLNWFFVLLDFRNSGWVLAAISNPTFAFVINGSLSCKTGRRQTMNLGMMSFLTSFIRNGTSGK